MLKNSDNTQKNCTFVLVQLLLFDNAIILYLCANRKAKNDKNSTKHQLLSQCKQLHSSKYPNGGWP